MDSPRPLAVAVMLRLALVSADPGVVSVRIEPLNPLNPDDPRSPCVIVDDLVGVVRLVLVQAVEERYRLILRTDNGEEVHDIPSWPDLVRGHGPRWALQQWADLTEAMRPDPAPEPVAAVLADTRADAALTDHMTYNTGTAVSHLWAAEQAQGHDEATAALSAARKHVEREIKRLDAQHAIARQVAVR